MSCYYISSNKKYINFFEMLLKKLEELKKDINYRLVSGEVCARRYAEIVCASCDWSNIKIAVKDIMKDIILINYKHLFFKKCLNINISDKSLESLFFTSITLYDRDYDSDILSLDELADKEMSVDGIFQFCIKDLHLRWINVAEILQDNFYNDNDRDAIIEFVKHIIYSIPCKVNEVNIYKKDGTYRFIDKEGKSLADFISYNGGELASKIMFISPALINFCGNCDRQTMMFLKNIFNDRIRFY